MNEDNFDQLTQKIIDCAMEIHQQMGTDFQEVVYQRALSIELFKQGILYARELEMKSNHKGKDVGKRQIDFLIETKVMLEIKALEKLKKVHEAHAINYCEAYKISDGLLIHFGQTSLQFHRLYNNKLRTKWAPKK